MTVGYISPESLPQLQAQRVPIVDVRTPSEYAHGHIPGACNLPLFSDEEHACVGTLYKQHSRQQAIDQGLAFVGPKMQHLAQEGKRLSYCKRIVLYCARGGMRSGSMAWLLDLYGLEVMVIEGGYRVYKEWRNEILLQPRRYNILGGPTGSGKTRLLHLLAQAGAQVVDLEGLAHHRGSAFGSMNPAEPQPSSEAFANELAHCLYPMDTQTAVWLESESPLIGSVSIPKDFYRLMQQGRYFHFEMERGVRIRNIVEEYSSLPKEYLLQGFDKIRKRVGDATCREATQAVRNDDYTRAVDLALHYYDKAYQRSSASTWGQPFFSIQALNDQPETWQTIVNDLLRFT